MNRSSIRTCGRAELAAAFIACRARTLRIFDALEQGLPGLRVPEGSPANPVLWEVGHIGWFQEHWTSRHVDRHLGWDASPDAPRTPSIRAEADSLYDSTRVPHHARASLPLPSASQTRDELQRQLQGTLDVLADAPDSDRGLYAFRLALLHEVMHQESMPMTAQVLGVPFEEEPKTRRRGPPRWISIPGGPRPVGWCSEGFAFDNELPSRPVVLQPFRIASREVRWEEFLPFVEQGGYCQRQWWSEAGWAWRMRKDVTGPLHLKRDRGQWRQHRFGRWHRVDEDAPATHLSQHEALAWCAWAGRRLPTEHEWEVAAVEAGASFEWGAVWEWTCSPFQPYAGFRPHPYAAYSQPWFDGRPVLKGASWVHELSLRDARYRNFFPADRNDLFAGFRCCDR